MRILAIDYGDVKIGLAMSDPLGITAQPLLTIKNNKNVFNEIKKIVQEYSVEKIIAGLPLNMNGSYGKSSEKVISFIEELKNFVNIDIEFIDERLTTEQAEKTLIESDISRKKRKKNIDKVTASIILQTYLERKRC